jgi:hypothetical protein
MGRGVAHPADQPSVAKQTAKKETLRRGKRNRFMTISR